MNYSTQQTPVTDELIASVSDHAGDVYVLNNSRIDNKVVHFIRSSDGSLMKMNSYSTGGLGSGFPLGSQGALCMSADQHWLFAVNTGSNEISVFKVDSMGLALTDKKHSFGFGPISLTHHGNLLYVLNNAVGLTGKIAGFTVSDEGKLTYIQDSKMDISSETTNPAQIAFNNDGTSLLITLKRKQQIVSYELSSGGTPSSKYTVMSAGIEPFGFAVDANDNLIVSEAFAGATGKSTVSSYHVNDESVVALIDGLNENYQTASCWVSLTPDNRYAYVSNTGSATVSGYSVVGDGSLALLTADGVAGNTGLAPIDIDVTPAGDYLYVLNADDHNISAFAIDAITGQLKPVGIYGDLLHNAAGLVAD